MSDIPGNNKSRLRIVLVVAIVVVVFYPLSTGPAFVVSCRMNLVDEIEPAYYPVFAFCEATNTETFLSRYLDWWLNVTETKFPG